MHTQPPFRPLAPRLPDDTRAFARLERAHVAPAARGPSLVARVLERVRGSAPAPAARASRGWLVDETR